MQHVAATKTKTKMAMRSHPVDLERPILEQVGALEDYWTWVHRPQKPGRSLRIFRSSLLESFSHIPWWLVLLVWVPVIVALFAYAVLGRGVAHATWLAVLGLFVWTFVEYALHRFVFHHEVRSPFARRLHFLAHGIHHLDPWDPLRLVFPPLPGVLLAAPVFGLLYLGSLWTADPLGTACVLMGGLLVGYLIYDMSHYYQHHAKPRSRLGRWLKRYHLEHHHKHPQGLYGVSNPLWDVLLGTGRSALQARELAASEDALGEGA